MTEAQIQLQNALTTTFLANLAFLSEYDNELYHRIDELSRMIENGTYEEKYALEFNMQDGDFDIFDIVNNKYLYNKQPKKKSDELVRKVELDEKNAILNIEEVFTFKQIFDVKKDNRFNFNTLETIAYTSNQMQDYKNITKDYLDDKKKKLKNIKKFIFLGTLLGRHIPRISKKVNADLYIVLEKNLEIFRLSLFTVDYKILAQKGVIFSIMDEAYKEEEKIRLFLDIYKYDNYLLKFSTTGINIDDYISKILAITTSNKPTIYDHNRKLYIHLNRTTKRITEQYNFLQFKNISENLNYFSNLPILYLAAGPSIDENIEWIKDNQNRFFIACVGSSLNKLLINNIKIDAIFTLDEKEILEEFQFNDQTISLIPENTLLFASTISHEKVLKKFPKNRVFLFEIFRPFFKDNIPFNGYSVGEIALDILMKLNPKEIYLLGLDLALNQDTGNTHAKNSNSEVKTYDMTKKDDRNLFGLNISTLKVKGNFKKSVVTSALFHTSINFLEQQILINKPKHLNIYNLSKNGAYFNGTIPLKIKDIDISKLKNININFDELYNLLNSFSLQYLDKESSQMIYSDIKSINIILELLENLQKLNFNTFDELTKECTELIFEKVKDLELQFLGVILDKYYLLVIPYLEYYFNSISIKDEKKKLDKIKDIFMSQLKEILLDSLFIFSKLKNKP